MTLLDEASRMASEAIEKLSEAGYEAAVLAVSRASLMLKIAHGEASVTQSWLTRSTSAYVAKDKRMAVYSSESPEPWRDILEASRSLRALEESPLYAPLPEPSGSPLSRVDEKIRDAALTGDASFILEDLELSQLGDAAGMVLLEYTATALATTAGAELAYEATRFNGYMRVFRGEASGQWSWTSTVYDVNAAKRALGQAVQLAEECSRLPKATIEPGEYRVLLGPMVVGNLAEELVSSASAGSVIFGMSFLREAKPGDTIASEALTVEDKPRDTSLPLFRGFDDEGVATRDKAIVERGVFKGFLHNTKTARLMGASTTGNAGWIMPTPFNIHIAPGTLKPDDMLDSLWDGVYITNNWYTRFQNYLEGEFSTVSRDAVFLVKNGEPRACLGRIRIADRMPRLMKVIEDLSAERWPIQWWEVSHPTLAPYVLLSKARLSVADV